MRGIGFGREQLRVQVSMILFRFKLWPSQAVVTLLSPCQPYVNKVWGSSLRFKFCQYLNLNLPRGLGSHILSNLNPEPRVQIQVWTRFGRFRNQTAASLLSSHSICEMHWVTWFHLILLENAWVVLSGIEHFQQRNEFSWGKHHNLPCLSNWHPKPQQANVIQLWDSLRP